jgi:hypothetical protein
VLHQLLGLGDHGLEIELDRLQPRREPRVLVAREGAQDPVALERLSGPEGEVRPRIVGGLSACRRVGKLFGGSVVRHVVRLC